MENENVNEEQNLPLENEVKLDFTELQQKFTEFKAGIGNYVVGNEQTVQLLMIALLSNGHVLLEGMPGIAKTLTAKLMAAGIRTQFSRIQFTPDLMPSDIIGTNVFNSKNQEFEFIKGPVFTNLLLIDEINRSPAKTQAALFEVMEEQQITVDGKKYAFDFPFMALATQNPIEQEGTYQLPEAQLDRFLFKINMDYPSAENELLLLQKIQQRSSLVNWEEIPQIIAPEELKKYQLGIDQIEVKDTVLKYIVDIIQKTRNHPAIEVGASPRASIGVLKTAKANAALEGRAFITPDDIKFVAPYVLNHRLIIRPEKEMEGASANKIALDIINQIEVPR